MGFFFVRKNESLWVDLCFVLFFWVLDGFRDDVSGIIEVEIFVFLFNNSVIGGIIVIQIHVCLING